MGDAYEVMDVTGKAILGREDSATNSKPSFTDDFICISEFSEIVGPVPLFCIPAEGKGAFNIEKFVIRIMAVDYQNKSCDPGAFVDDTQVVISEPTESAFAYVHHFTLLDVFARGYVRPICMSYITRHPTKIMDNFAKLMKKFNKVSRIFKAGNQLVFLEDLKHRLADLYHTREILQQKKNLNRHTSSSDTAVVSEGAAGAAGAVESSESTNGTVAAGHRPRKESTANLEPVVLASSSSTVATAAAVEGEPLSASTPPMNTPAGRPSESIEIKKGNKADQDQELHGFLNPDDPGTSFIPPTPNIVNETIKEMESIRRRFHNNILKTQHDSTRGKNRLLSAEDTSMREYSQDKFETEDDDDEEDDIFMEADYSIGGIHGDENVHEQSDAAAETDGDRNADDENAESEDAYEEAKGSDEDEHSDLRSEERILAGLYQKLGMSLPDSEYKPQVLKTLYKGRRYDTKLRELTELCGKAYQQAVEKLNKIQSNYSRPSTVLELEDEEYGYAEPSSSLLTLGGSIVCNFNLEAYTRSPHKRSSARDTPRSSFSSPYVTRHGSNSSPTPKDVGESTSDASSGSSSYDSPAQLTPPTDQPMISPEPFDEAILTRKLMGLDGSTVAPHVLVVPPERAGTPPLLANSTPDRKKEPKSKSNLETFASVLWDCSTTNAGKGISKLLRYTFVRHLVFSLLKGRPVIIYGTPQNENPIRELVTACSLFVPGSGRGANVLISHWRTKPIHMSDLAYLKLIGLSKRVTIPKAVERYVSILDYESAQLRCPPYNKGNLIEKILGLHSHWPDEKTHLAYIHYKLLEAATQACLYYQICCVANNHAYAPPAQATTRSSFYSGADAGRDRNSATKSSRADSNSRGPENGRMGSSGRGTGLDDREKDDSGDTKRNSTLSIYPYQAGADRAPGAPSAMGSSGDVGRGSMFHRSYHSEGQISTIASVPSVPNSAREQTKNAFFKQIKAKPHDMAVIEYFAEVVKEQQSLEMHGPGAQIAPVIHLDYSPCQLFKNVKEKGKGGK